MLRTISISFAIACVVACASSPAPTAASNGVAVESAGGGSVSPPEAQPESPPDAKTCADLGGTCMSVVAAVACAEWHDTPDCGANTGCCVQAAAQPAPNTPTMCHWKVADTCFDSAELACKAAGCTLDKCIQSKSLPVQVSCSK